MVHRAVFGILLSPILSSSIKAVMVDTIRDATLQTMVSLFGRLSRVVNMPICHELNGI